MKTNIPKLFLIDVGNTHARYGLMEDGVIITTQNCDTADLGKLDISDEIPIAAATVVPKAKDYLKRKDIFWVDNIANTGIDLKLVDASEVGADRIANLAALSSVSSLPAMIVDCGTAVTVEVLDSNKVFRGGQIAPGRFLLRKALSEYTALLPFLPVDDIKAKTFGWDTPDAIRLGTDFGLIGAVKEFISQAKIELGVDDCPVFITGGDAKILLEHIKGVEPVPESFTLLGIAAIWKMNYM